MKARHWWRMAVLAAVLYVLAMVALWQESPPIALGVCGMVAAAFVARGAYLRWQIARILRTG